MCFAPFKICQAVIYTYQRYTSILKFTEMYFAVQGPFYYLFFIIIIGLICFGLQIDNLLIIENKVGITISLFLTLFFKFLSHVLNFF